MTVTPSDGLVDELPAIRVTEAVPESTVELEVRTVDAGGHRWRSVTSFHAGGDGTVDLSRDAPIHGRYSGVDAAGPLWAMEFVSDNEAPIAFVAPCDGLDYEFEARSNGVSTSQRVLRRWMSAGVSTPITPTTVPWSADLVSGGTAQGNAQAQAAAWAGRLAFLAKHLGQ